LVASCARGTEADAGQPGDYDPICGPGFPAFPIDATIGEHVALVGSSCALSLPDSVSEGGALVAQFSGAPGAIALLAASASASSLYLEPYLGGLHLGAPLIVFVSAPLPLSGASSVALPIGLLPTGVDARQLIAQTGLSLPSGAFQLCAPRTLTVLDSQS